MHTSYLGIDDEDEVAGTLKNLNGHFAHMVILRASGTPHLERLRVSEDDILRYHFINYVTPNSSLFSHPLDTLKGRMREMLRADRGVECADYALRYAKGLEQAFYSFKQICDEYMEDVEGRT